MDLEKNVKNFFELNQKIHFLKIKLTMLVIGILSDMMFSPNYKTKF